MRKKRVTCEFCKSDAYNTECYQLKSLNNHIVYFCNENCCDLISDYELKVAFIKCLLIDVLGVKSISKSLDKLIKSKIIAYKNDNTFEFLYQICCDEYKNIALKIENKSFSNNQSKLNYVFAILKNMVQQKLKDDEKISKLREIAIGKSKYVECGGYVNNKKRHDISRYLKKGE